MTQTEDEKIESTQRGQLARLVNSEVSNLIVTFEASVINKLVSYYDSNKITHDMLLSGIAEISAYRKLIRKLDREIKEGIEAQAERYS